MPFPKLNSPVVLVHGFCGFERFSVGGVPIAEYFYGIPALLQKAGNRVLIPWLSPTRGVADRARELKKFLNANAGEEPVHIIAHSMGGLDSRYLISQMNMADRVLSLTTLGTPHYGTAFADWGIRHWERVLKPIAEIFGIPTKAVYDMTTEECRKFNDAVPDVPNVHYFSVAGNYSGEPFRPELLLSAGIVQEMEGPNDGVVSVRSASYGERIAVWPSDHLQLVNWNNGIFPAGPIGDRGGDLYRLILDRLKLLEGQTAEI